jgi:hypothetical protein
MIISWRQIWNQRTNGLTDIHFPFGFVQVSIIQNYEKYVHTYISEKNVRFHRYQQLQIQLN